MRTFTAVLAQMYERQAIGTQIPEEKAANHILEEFDIDTTVYDKDELAEEKKELQVRVEQLEGEKRDLQNKLEEARAKTASIKPATIPERSDEGHSPKP